MYFFCNGNVRDAHVFFGLFGFKQFFFAFTYIEMQIRNFLMDVHGSPLKFPINTVRIVESFVAIWWLIFFVF